jgi:hypothetical protein
MHVWFLGTFAKLQKVTISFIVSLHMEQLGSHWLGDFLKTCRVNPSLIKI